MFENTLFAAHMVPTARSRGVETKCICNPVLRGYAVVIMQ